MWKRAKSWAITVGPGLLPNPKDETNGRGTMRLDQSKVVTFLEFLTSEFMLNDVPWGHTVMKTTTGKTNIEARVRTMRQERIVKQYYKYLKEMGTYEDLKMSRSSLIQIIRWCPAKTSKALAGLDYITQDGKDGFSSLIQLTRDLGRMGLDKKWEQDTVKGFREMDQYIRSDYKLHLKRESRISDHCMQHSLNDPKNLRLRTPGNHDHKYFCINCERLKHLLTELKEKVASAPWPNPLTQQQALWRCGNAITAVEKWKAHQLRIRFLDDARKSMPLDLTEEEIFIVMDWAMKYLPKKFRETQSDWFAKKGVPWHICVIYMKRNSVMYKITVLHVFDQNSQASSDVTAILEHVLRVVLYEVPTIKSATVRSDNAGAYHSQGTHNGLSIRDIQISIVIKSWSFSEPQSGKGDCDRAASRIKRHVNSFVSEGHDVRSADQFLDATASVIDFQDCSIFTGKFRFYDAPETAPSGDVEGEHGQRGASQTRARRRKAAFIPGISSFFHFDNINDELIAWNYPNIGVGMPIPFDPYLIEPNRKEFVVTREQHEGKATREKDGLNYWRMVGTTVATESLEGQEFDENNIEQREENGEQPMDTGTDEGQDIVADDRSLLFDCPIQGCIKQFKFHKNLERHVILGDHKYSPVRESTQDVCQNLYVQLLEQSRFVPNLPDTESTAEQLGQQGLECGKEMNEGWARQTRRDVKRFSPEQRSYLDKIFDEGRKTGRKAVAADIQSQMQSEVIDGKPRFSPDEYLDERQIMSYWKRRAKQLEKQQDEPQGGETATVVEKPVTVADVDMVDSVDELPMIDEHLFDIIEQNADVEIIDM